jgi:hypothetical protein
MKTFIAIVFPTSVSVRSALPRFSASVYGTILFLLLFSVNAQAGESVAKRVEGILVPPPKEMIDVSDFSDQFRQLAKAGLEHGQILIGLYCLPSEISLSEGQVRSRNARAFVLLSFSSEDLAKKRFQDEMNLLERDIPIMTFSSKAMKDLIEAGQKDVRAISGLVRADVKGTTWIEKSVAKGQSSYIIGLVNVTLPLGGKDKEYTMVYCCGWQRVKTKIIQLIYSVTLKDETSIDFGRKEFQEWIKVVGKSNSDSK